MHGALPGPSGSSGEFEPSFTGAVKRNLVIKCKSRRAMVYLVGLSVITVFIAWMALGAYQSHYLSALRILGNTTATSIVGVPKEGRGDEWATYLPMLKQAYLEGFPYRSALEPYHERLEWFISLPHWDISLLFLPNQATYWLFSGGEALSFQGFYYNAMLLGSLCWFLWNLGVRARFALAAALALLFSQFYQVWWTSNFPSLGVCFLPFAIYSSGMKPVYKFAALFWAIGHLLLGQMYPPFYLSLALATLPIMVAIRPDLIHPRSVAVALLSSAAAFAVYLGLKFDFVSAVSATSYPGHRFETGGGSSLSTLVGIIFPTYPAHTPFDVGDTVHELSVIGTFFPLLLVALLPSVKWDRTTIRVTLVSLLVSLFFVVYLLWGFPASLAKWTGLFLVPGRRAQLGLSVLVLVYSIFLLSRNFDRIRAIPLLLVAFGYAMVSLVVGARPDLASNFFGEAYYPYAFVSLAVLGYGASFIFSAQRPAALIASSLIVGMTAVQVLVFGSFNPVMRARDIMTPVDSQLIRDWKALYNKNNNKPIAIVGSYGHLLRGEGLEALEAIHLANVNREIYFRVFPELSSAEVDVLFNQFRGIAFDNVAKFDVRGLTVFFPAEGHSVSFSHDVVLRVGTGTGLLNGGATSVVSRHDNASFDVFWKGALLGPMPIEERLSLVLGCSVQYSWMTRYPLTAPGAPMVDVALEGIAGHLVINADNESDVKTCVSRMAVNSTDASLHK
jgi:hypothetical protein